jgi:hypothetical protein
MGPVSPFRSLESYAASLQPASGLPSGLPAYCCLLILTHEDDDGVDGAVAPSASPPSRLAGGRRMGAPAKQWQREGCLPYQNALNSAVAAAAPTRAPITTTNRAP